MALLVALTIPAVSAHGAPGQEDAARERKLAVLSQIYREAEGPETKANQRELREEFMERSEEFVKLYPDEPTVWLFRADIALKLDRRHEGWDAGRNLTRLGLDQSDKELIKEIFIRLERKKWLGEKDPQEEREAKAKKTQEDERKRQSEALAANIAKLRKRLADVTGLWKPSITTPDGYKTTGQLKIGVDSSGTLDCEGSFEVVFEKKYKLSAVVTSCSMPPLESLDYVGVATLWVELRGNFKYFGSTEGVFGFHMNKKPDVVRDWAVLSIGEGTIEVWLPHSREFRAIVDEGGQEGAIVRSKQPDGEISMVGRCTFARQN